MKVSRMMMAVAEAVIAVAAQMASSAAMASPGVILFMLPPVRSLTSCRSERANRYRGDHPPSFALRQATESQANAISGVACAWEQCPAGVEAPSRLDLPWTYVRRGRYLGDRVRERAALPSALPPWSTHPWPNDTKAAQAAAFRSCGARTRTLTT